MTTQHEPQLLGAYVLGALEEQEVRTVEEHLASCPECRGELDELRAMEAYLGDVPPEALLDGPPEGGDLLLARRAGVRVDSGVGVQGPSRPHVRQRERAPAIAAVGPSTGAR